MEVWKKIEGYDYYMVSNYGQVKSLDRKVTGKNGVTQNRKGKILKLVVDNGYKVVTLRENNKSSNQNVHVLVARAFVTGYQSGLIVNHIDGNKLNCLSTNLEWVTHQENNLHAIQTGLNKLDGEDNVTSKLSEDEVKWIRANYIPRDKEFGGKALAKNSTLVVHK